MPPTLYSMDMSPPCRGVLLAATALGVELNVIETSLHTQDNLKPEFVKMNPAHTIPTLVDDAFVLWDSHAIMCYLSTKYGKDDSLYPKNPQLRAQVDQFLYFDVGYLMGTVRLIGRPIYITGVANVPDEKIEILNSAYDILENLLEGRTWLVGDSYTLADISCASSMSSLSAFRPMDKYPNMKAWFKRCEETLPGFAEKNGPGNKMFHDYLRTLMPGYL